MLRWLLDTNVLSEPIARRPRANVLVRLADRGGESATATPVLHDLRYGASLLEPSRRRRELERHIDDVVLRVYPVLAYDDAAAEWHARERARLARLGKPPAMVDGLIAAIAVVNDLVVVTRNVRHFAAFKGVTAENWG